MHVCLDITNVFLSLGSDKRFYENELCFDAGTLASEQLGKFKLNSDEKELIKNWEDILTEAKKTENYNKKLTYGLYQIEMELNTSERDENNKTIYDYPTLNGEIENLKKEIKGILRKIYHAKNYLNTNY